MRMVTSPALVMALASVALGLDSDPDMVSVNITGNIVQSLE